MSAHKPAIRLTSRAERDVENILLHTERSWGVEQSGTYANVIAQAFTLLSNHPQLGRQRDDLFPGCRGVRVEQHVIYYHQPRPHDIEIIRILHGRQDPTGNVEGPAS